MTKGTVIETQHVMGVVLIVVSAVVFSTAGVFTKAVESGAWEVIFWRGVFAAGFTMLYTASRRTIRREFLDMGRSGLAVAIVGATGSAAFISAFKLTTMANVMLIYAAAPLIAAAIAWVWIRERPTPRVAAGCFVALAGVLIIIQGSFELVSLRGDLLALWMAVAMAMWMVIYRRCPATPAAGPAALSSILLLPPALYLGAPFSVPFGDFATMAAFGLVFAVASVTLGEGARRVPAGETALLSALETPLAPVLGWMIFQEVPAGATILGGGLILAAVLATQIRRPGS